jgi:hypothetical protein
MSEEFMQQLVQEWGGWGLLVIAILAVIFIWFHSYDTPK